MFSQLIIPFEYLMNCMYTYVREAERFVNISVYKITCEFTSQVSHLEKNQSSGNY